ncbi:hypothetical protein VNI00_001431 [Paramarasmius palmivorus]|uniref:Amino acid transporter transmembrane domain-containing protein n=1 Tax=Paramarasmius palmivorus TaxID=297713 RepID=A0AAW0E4C2_9AGAR
MSLPSTGFVFGSAASGSSFRDAIASYRRSQYYVAGSTVASSGEDSAEFDDDEFRDEFEDEEALIGDFDDDALDTPHPERSHDRDSGLIGQFHWDDDLGRTSTPAVGIPSSVGSLSPSPPAQGILTTGSYVSQTQRNVQSIAESASGLASSPPHRISEATPLLRPKVSFSSQAGTPGSYGARRTSEETSAVASGNQVTSDDGRRVQDPEERSRLTLRRRSSASSSKTHLRGQAAFGGHSTFGQTLFNSIAILLGIGMLSEPLAFAYAGWVAGTALIILYGGLSCYTAKILARIIRTDPRLRSYADIGRKAFGPRSTVFISIMFCLELFAVAVVLVTLYADSLHAIIPTYSANTYKLWGLLLLIPTVFLPLSLLSYTSILGILSTILLVVVVLADGLSKTEYPGSLWSPAETSLSISSWTNLGLAYGLFMAGFSGHAVIPSLARDMANPEQFDTMINWAFFVATSIYTLIGCAGYLMFGNQVSQEISMDLLRTPGFNPVLNKIALWMLVVSPLSKFALTTQPLNAALEVLVGIESGVTTPEDMAMKMAASMQWTKRDILSHFQRILVTLAAVGVSVAVPEFDAMMAFLGSFSAFMICIIGPISAKVALERRCGIADGIILVIGLVMAAWGTGSAFVAASEGE